MDYLDFDLHLAPAPNGYRVRATNAQGASASADFVLPFAPYEIENLFLRVGRPRRGVRKIESPEMKAAKEFGGKLFDAVFTGEVFGMWRSSLNAAAQQSKGLRLRLRLSDAPGLSDLPWEFLYDKSLNRFVAPVIKTPLVRYLDLPTAIQPLQIALPLRVLVMIADASDYDALDVEREWKNLEMATQELRTRGVLTLERLEQATLMGLRRALRQSAPHIFHFIGHGKFDANEQDGVLIFKNEQGRGQRVSSQMLGQVFVNFDSLRLVVLNACEGARTSRDDPFAGVAPSLVQQEIPAVIAMQFEVSDDAAIKFAEEFYSALAAGDAVDTAVSHARSAILTDVNDLEWGTPVLYMRAPNGVIFDLKQVVALPRIEPKVESLPSPAPEPKRETTPVQLNPVEQQTAEGQKRAAEMQERSRLALEEQKRRLQEAIDAGKRAQVTPPPPPKIQLPARKTNKAGQEMILIAAGEFLMGTSDAEAKRLIQEFGKDWEKWVKWEQPQHTVSLDAFYISRYPVTNAEYKKFKPDWKIPNGKENHPVVNVSWDDAVAFCKWVEGDLPTEAQWEKAASWDDAKKIKRVFPWSDVFDKDKCNSSELKIRDTTPVGKYSPQGDSFFGVGDMAGNVWEWCADWFDENFYKNSPRENPRNDTQGQYRVLRGGSFDNVAPNARCAGRYGSRPDSFSSNRGFRVVAAPV